MKRWRSVSVSVASLLVVGGAWVGSLSAQQQGAGQNPGQPAAQPAAQQPAAQPGQAQPAPGISPQLIGEMMQAMAQTEGCLGVDAARMQSGRLVIFGWFDSKAALLRWYNDPKHTQAMDIVSPGRDKNREPMSDIPDDSGPLMAVASASMIPPDRLAPGQAPGSIRLGIEIYRPMPGGVRFSGGSFAPEGFMPGLRDIDAPATRLETEE